MKVVGNAFVRISREGYGIVTGEEKMSNRLKNETSPYLLQHAENPVDWYGWCQEAFEKARLEDKPIFLSIGYSTCHWCHVMAHESFEDERTASLLNQNFVSIKVDREERPDVDSVYMSVCQAFTGSGGWPMSIFMTWDKKPFFAGTYFPVQSRYGMPGFCDVLKAIVDSWKQNRQELLQSANEIVSHLQHNEYETDDCDSENIIENAVWLWKRSFDKMHGGFGLAPKFPAPHNLLCLLLYARQNEDKEALHMVEETLLQMRKGGIFDQIGYGFSRYSTDARFLVPHFEKMLYDNGLLIMAYAAAYSATNNHLYLDTAEKTAAYILREMTSESGGFYSAQDADSEGVEGKFYTFTFDEIIRVLGKENGTTFAKIFDITPEGNFEGKNIPNLLKSNGLGVPFDEERQRLYQYRRNRTELHLDDKMLIGWNSLMIAALAMLYRVSKNETYLQAAEKAQRFIQQNLCEGCQLYTSYRNGTHSEKAFLDDYAFYTAALLELYHATLEHDYLKQAEQFCTEAEKRFEDYQGKGFYLCQTDANELFLNPKETYDGAIPSGNAVMAYNFVRLYQLTEKDRYKESAEKQLAFLTGQSHEYPVGHGMFLLAKQIYENPPEQIVIVVKAQSDLGNVGRKLPFLCNASVQSESREYPRINDQTTYYVCKNHMCMPPENRLKG